MGQGLRRVQAQRAGRLCVGTRHHKACAQAGREQAAGAARLDRMPDHTAPRSHRRQARSGLPLVFRDGRRASRRHARRPVPRHRRRRRSVANLAPQVRIAGRSRCSAAAARPRAVRKPAVGRRTMTAPVFRLPGWKVKVPGRAGKSRRKGRQDRSRTLISPKAAVFQRFGAGTSVGERAARKKKASKLKAPNGTTGHFRRKAARP